MSYIFYSWIPTLGEIDFEIFFNQFRKNNNVSFKNGECIYTTILDDRYLNNRDESVNIEIEFDNKFKVKKLIRKGNSKKLCNESEDYVLAEIINLSKNGDVYFKINAFEEGGIANEDKEAKFLASQTYAILKTIYHMHTHHNNDVDMLLKVYSIGKDINEKEKLLKDYFNKINEYHIQLNENQKLIKSLHLEDRETYIMLVKKAYGEMIYAIAFCNFNDFNDKKFVFEEAKDSFELIVNLSNLYNTIVNNFFVLLTLIATIIIGLFNKWVAFILFVFFLIAYFWADIIIFCAKKNIKLCEKFNELIKKVRV